MKIKPCDLCTHLWAGVNPCINVIVLFLITIRVLQMEQSRWIKNKKTADFISGVTEFMNLAESTKRRIGDADYILCHVLIVPIQSHMKLQMSRCT